MVEQLHIFKEHLLNIYRLKKKKFGGERGSGKVSVDTTGDVYRARVVKGVAL